MIQEPTVSDCLDEIRRLRAENERLKRLVQTQRPELEKLRQLVTAIRDMAISLPHQMEHVYECAEGVIGTTDDLPSFQELRGILSDGRDRVEAALDKPADPPIPRTKEAGLDG